MIKKYLSETIGTFFLVFAGTGSIVIDQVTHGGVTPVGIGLTFGLVVLVLIYSLGAISGAHFNPAVSIAFALTGNFSFREVPLYILSQICGAVLASMALYVLFGNIADLGATVPHGSWVQSFGLEFLLSFLLMFVITSVSTNGREVGQMAGLAIGLTVGLCATFAGPICGASMNPARSFGPALISMQFTHHWIYWLGPICGACLGALTSSYLQTDEGKMVGVDGLEPPTSSL